MLSGMSSTGERSLPDMSQPSDSLIAKWRVWMTWNIPKLICFGGEPCNRAVGAMCHCFDLICQPYANCKTERTYCVVELFSYPNHPNFSCFGQSTSMSRLLSVLPKWSHWLKKHACNGFVIWLIAGPGVHSRILQRSLHSWPKSCTATGSKLRSQDCTSDNELLELLFFMVSDIDSEIVGVMWSNISDYFKFPISWINSEVVHGCSEPTLYNAGWQSSNYHALRISQLRFSSRGVQYWTPQVHGPQYWY